MVGKSTRAQSMAEAEGSVEGEAEGSVDPKKIEED